MAEEQESQPREAPAKKKSKMPIIIAAIVVVNVGALGAFFFLTGRGGGGGGAEKPEKKEAAKGAEADHEKDEGGKAGESGIGPLIMLDSFIVNVDQAGAHYLKAELSVEIENAEKKKEFDELKPLVRNEILLALSSLEVEKAKTVRGKKDLEKRITESIRKRLGNELVRNVYFTEFVTQ